MKYIINNIRASLEDGIEDIKKVASRKLNIPLRDITNFKITKESIDARRKPNICLVYSVLAETNVSIKNIHDPDIKRVEEAQEEVLKPGTQPLSAKPVVVGTGPAGLFAGLLLAQQGYRPIVLERGECVEKRTAAVEEYWKKGKLNPETNVQFGEGGAGTFSDGKLTTRINDRRCELVLKELYRSGAPEEILYKAKPHIGTDILKNVVINMRKRIEELGGEVRFNSKMTSILTKDGKITGLKINQNEELNTEVIVLAIGHSARDTFYSLFESGVRFIQKPFSIGVRIEHPQEVINEAQFGKAASHPRLGAADYQLFYKMPGRTAYSFCMCPGGIVVASASEPDTIVTNGMSEFARDRENANSALVVSVEPRDFEGSHPLAGIEFQRKWEKLAFGVAGKNSSAPVQRLEDFMENRASSRFGKVKPSYTGNTQLADINACLPEFVTNPMKESIGYFDRKLRGFGMKDALLTGVETRTSSPVRIPRGDNLEAEGIKGLYPAGEGAGYAGGIVSAAVDGIRIAERIISTYTQPK
ncbi:MAG: FAD-dependent oxidoreductase [Clostridia bacterium]|nr:FAD-dependent oxidoreductase [Clostridia bacterium]